MDGTERGGGAVCKVVEVGGMAPCRRRAARDGRAGCLEQQRLCAEREGVLVPDLREARRMCFVSQVLRRRMACVEQPREKHALNDDDRTRRGTVDFHMELGHFSAGKAGRGTSVAPSE